MRKIQSLSVIVSIPNNIPAPPPFFSAIRSNTVKRIAPITNAKTVIVRLTIFSASTTIPNIATDMRMPAPNEVSANICRSEKFILLDKYMPRNDEKPANPVNIIVLSMSRVLTLENAAANTEYSYKVNQKLSKEKYNSLQIQKVFFNMQKNYINN